MSLQPRPWPEIPQMTARVARAAFAKDALAIRIRDALGPLFADEEFIGVFGVLGRPGLSPGQLALVSVLQYAENLSDRQAPDRIGWKYALGRGGTGPMKQEATEVAHGHVRHRRNPRASDPGARQIGLTKTHLGHVLASTAINLIRLDAWLSSTLLGTTRTPHFTELKLAA